MPDIAQFEAIRQQTELANAQLIAVSKRKPAADVLALYELGQRDFGENYVQELVEKQGELPQDIHWHFIGSLQRNKVRDIVPFVHLIHGGDSMRLLVEINKRAQQVGRIVDVLLQVHVAQENTKSGFNPDELLAILEQQDIHRLAWVRISGIMGMASNTRDEAQLAREFTQLRELFDHIGKTYYDRRPEWNTLSIGMSGDFQLALKHGSTAVRIGSAIFGAR